MVQQAPRPNSRDEQALMAELWSESIADSPLNFVLFAFPWGKKGTPLENFKGPKKWQREELTLIAKHIQENKVLMKMGLPPMLYQSATASGRGVGKSSLVAWLILWMNSCVIGSSTIVTANTEDQLKSKTWAELGKWHTLSINSHWFEKNALSFKPHDWLVEALKRQLKIDSTYYYALAQLWSEEKPDSFAGAHNMLGMMVIYDEASGIPKPIWTVTKGFFTEPVLHRYWFCFSNPRRNSGAFFECFNASRDFWRRRHLDARTVEGTDTQVYDDIIKEHGEDSDEAKVEVKGEFPNLSERQFINRELVREAAQREVFDNSWAPLMMGVDPARYGSAKTVIRFRRGRDARSIPPMKMKGKGNMEVANEIANLINIHNPDAVCIDTGNGGGIIDRLREMGYKVFEVNFGGHSPKKQWQNLRTFIWAEMRDWMSGGCIDPDFDLMADLGNPEYKFVQSSDVIRLETKDEMLERGLPSPDDGDALACTFAVKIASKSLHSARRNPTQRNTLAIGVDYNPLG